MIIRILDIFFSLTAIIFFLPIFIPVSLILKFTGESEIFYLQKRVGKDGEIFNIFKFATMLKDSPNIGAGTITIKNDPRILPIGNFLRKTKINELPQLFNILIGDMSVIGPRPLTARGFDVYSKEAQLAIQKMRPGLSGIGSIIFRDEEILLSGTEDPNEFYDKYIAPYKGSLELWFSSKLNLKNYLLLIFITIWAVLFPKTQIVWKIFKSIPEPNSKISKSLNFLS